MTAVVTDIGRERAPLLDVSVVICTYTSDRWDQLQQAVASVLAQRRPAREVIIVVDHDDQLLERAGARWPAAEGLPVRVVASTEQKGLSGARNTGVREAGAEIVAFLDDDAEAEEGWIESLVAPYADPSVVVCGGAVEPRLEGDRPPWWPVEFDWVVGCSYVGLPSEQAEVRNVIGANMSARRTAILDAGGFVTDMGRVGTVPLGCEETELCIRLTQRSAGTRVLYEPAARVHHRVPAARLTWRYFRARCYAEGLSKSKVAARVTAGAALASERSYASKVLPRGVARAVRAAAGGELKAGARAFAILAGLALTAFGYARGRLKGALGRVDRLSATALALMVTTAITSLLGFVFWAVASRRYPAARVGEDAALISAMMLLSIVSQLNLGMGMARFLPQVRSRRWRPVLAAYGVAGGCGVVVASAFVLVAPRVSEGFGFLGASLPLAVGLVAAVVAWNVFALQDAALTAARRATVLPAENGVFGLLKIGVMVGLAGHLAGHGIFAAWLLAMVLMLVPVNAFLFGKVLPSRQGSAQDVGSTAIPVASRSKVLRYLGVDYAAALLSQGYNGLLPVLVTVVLGHVANAYFYVAFLIAVAVGALGQALTTSLVVEGAHDESQLPALARRSVRRYTTLVLPAVVVLTLGAPLVLAPFGTEYVEHGTTTLRLLLLGTVPQAIVSLYLGVERVRAQVARVLVLEAATVAVVTAGAVASMWSHGLPGVGGAWLAGHSLMAMVAAPRLWSVWREPRITLAGRFA